MRRILASILALLMVLSLTACKDTTDSPAPTPSPTPTSTPDAADPMDILSADSYWVAYESEGDTREYVPEGENLLTDLTLWADGTARIREIEDDMWLVSEDDEQSMTWTCDEDGTLKLYTRNSDGEPYHSGTVTADGITLNRFGGTYRFRQAPIPEGGALYSPAELQGVWMVYHTEVDGDETDVSGEFNTLVFEREFVANEKTLLASCEYGGGYLISEDEFSAYQFKDVTTLDQPIYSGCGNEYWSLRIGEESPLNEHDLPENTEIYVTLLDRNTLLQQKYFSFDNGTIPGVSYQIYKRFLPSACYDFTAEDLIDCRFELSGYTDANGNPAPLPDGLSSFTLVLTKYGYNFVAGFETDGDYYGGGGYREMGHGGTLHMTSEGSDEDWLAGAVQSDNGIPEIYLWFDGGILHLEYAEKLGDDQDGEWDGYIDTMDDLEGRAFSAPENTLFVIYNQNYANMQEFYSFPLYEVDDGPDAQYVLVTATMDDSYFWLDVDGFCAEDFGTVNAGESFIFKVTISDSNGPRLQIESSVGNYFYELTKSSMDMYENWNYITT